MSLTLSPKSTTWLWFDFHFPFSFSSFLFLTPLIIQCPKLTVITIAPLLAEAIRRLHTEKSLSNLFDPAKPSAVQQGNNIPNLNL